MEGVEEHDEDVAAEEAELAEEEGTEEEEAHRESDAVVVGALGNELAEEKIAEAENKEFDEEGNGDDAHATLRKFEEACEKEETQIAIDLYHPQAVIVKKDEHALYGEAIGESYRRIWAQIGPHTFELTNQKYQGTDDYKITDFDFELKKKENDATILEGKMLHIWKREGDKWLIYHEQYEVNQ